MRPPTTYSAGKTALKITLNRYLEGVGHDRIRGATGHPRADPDPSAADRLLRPWDDADQDFFPDCDLTIPQRQRRVRRGHLRGDLRQQHPRSKLRPRRPHRLGQARLQLGVHHQRPARTCAARVARRSRCAPAGDGNIRVMDDQAVTPADYSSFSIPVPSDLGGGTLTGITGRPTRRRRATSSRCRTTTAR